MANEAKGASHEAYNEAGGRVTSAGANHGAPAPRPGVMGGKDAPVSISALRQAPGAWRRRQRWARHQVRGGTEAAGAAARALAAQPGKGPCTLAAGSPATHDARPFFVRVTTAITRALQVGAYNSSRRQEIIETARYGNARHRSSARLRQMGSAAGQPFLLSTTDLAAMRLVSHTRSLGWRIATNQQHAGNLHNLAETRLAATLSVSPPRRQHARRRFAVAHRPQLHGIGGTESF